MGLFFSGLVFAAAAFSILVAVDGTHGIVRRIAGVLAFGSCIIFAFRSAIIIGVVVSLIGALLLEFGAIRVWHLRRALRRPSISLLARRGLPFYFSAMSVVFAATVVVSPLGAEISASPLPEKAVRFFIERSDPFLRPVIGFSLAGTVNEVIGNATGITDPFQIQEVRDRLATRLGIPLEGDEDVASVLAMTGQRELQRIQGGLGYSLRIGFLIAVFLLFRFLALPFTWVAIALLVPLLWIVRATKVAVDIEEPAVRSILRWHR